MKIIIISALSNNNVIGLNGKMPWHSKEEFKHFKNTTINNTILMGRKTFEGIGKALPGRLNIVISSNFQIDNSNESLIIFNSLDKAINYCNDKYDKLFICGGYQIYQQTLEIADEMILTRFKFDTEGDTYFPEVDFSKWDLYNTDKHDEFNVYYYKRRK